MGDRTLIRHPKLLVKLDDYSIFPFRWKPLFNGCYFNTARTYRNGFAIRWGKRYLRVYGPERSLDAKS